MEVVSGDNWSYKTRKIPVRSWPLTNHWVMIKYYTSTEYAVRWVTDRWCVLVRLWSGTVEWRQRVCHRHQKNTVQRTVSESQQHHQQLVAVLVHSCGTGVMMMRRMMRIYLNMLSTPNDERWVISPAHWLHRGTWIILSSLQFSAPA